MVKKKSSQARFVYEVVLDEGRNHPEWVQYSENVKGTGLKGIEPDYSGLHKIALVSSHLDAATVRLLASSEMLDRDAVSVKEITDKSLKGTHRIYSDTIRSYFLPHGEYPNLKSLDD